MQSDSTGENLIAELRKAELTDLFSDLARKGEGRKMFFLFPRTLKQREELASLQRLGLVKVETGEFRWDQASGAVKQSELVCELTEMGARAAMLLRS